MASFIYGRTASLAVTDATYAWSANLADWQCALVSTAYDPDNLQQEPEFQTHWNWDDHGAAYALDTKPAPARLVPTLADSAAYDFRNDAKLEIVFPQITWINTALSQATKGAIYYNATSRAMIAFVDFSGAIVFGTNKTHTISELTVSFNL